MATLLVGTEVAEGMGHVAPWSDFCRMAIESGHQVHMATPDLQVAHRFIGSIRGVKLWAAPRLTPSLLQVPARSWPELLVNLGYGQPDSLTGAVAAWVSVLESVAPDVVIADYAPMLMAASLALRIRYLEVGGGFCVPPVRADGSMEPFPGITHSATLRASIDAAMQKLGDALSKSLQRWSRRGRNRAWDDLHRSAAKRLVVSPAAFDHYDDRSCDPFEVEHVGFLGLGTAASPLRGAAPKLVRSPQEHCKARRIVGYLKSSTPGLETVFTSLVETGLPGRIHIPGAPPGFRSESLEVTASPIHLINELGHDVLFVTNGGLTSLGLAHQAGARICLYPQQAEQVAMLRRLSILSSRNTPFQSQAMVSCQHGEIGILRSIEPLNSLDCSSVLKRVGQ